MKVPELSPLDGNEKPEDDLLWHALNYRSAAPLHAEQAWQELTAYVQRFALAHGEAVREACAKLCDARASEEVGMAYAGIAEDCADAIRSNDADAA
jgi:hypothetical protein